MKREATKMYSLLAETCAFFEATINPDRVEWWTDGSIRYEVHAGSKNEALMSQCLDLEEIAVLLHNGGTIRYVAKNGEDVKIHLPASVGIAPEHCALYAAGYIKGSISARDVKTWYDGKTRYHVGALSNGEIIRVWLSLEDMASLLQQGETLWYFNKNGSAESCVL